MKGPFLVLIWLICLQSVSGNSHRALWVECESFSDKGGWVIDQQSMEVIGSPYLMAHGMGNPVEDASTSIQFPKKGTYRLFVRTRNWTAPWSEKSAGLFQVLINGKAMNQSFGDGSSEWTWVDGGSFDVEELQVEISLHDLTGFNGRCDALFFTPEKRMLSPEAYLEKKQKKDRDKAEDIPVGSFDFVVVGGGVAGTCAAISAARLGVRVALIQNRPVLGGNNSSEVRVHLGARINLDPYPALGNLVNEIGPSRGGNARPKEYYEDDKKLAAVLNEPNISLFLNHHAIQAKMNGDSITQVIAQDLESGEKKAFSAPLFADCTGDGALGFMAGAEFMSGRESREKYNEHTAPDKADNLTMGISVQWFSEGTDQAVGFPDIDWGLPWSEKKSFAITRGDWDWETGMGKDMIHETEQIRDYGLLVVFSNWSYLKNHHPDAENFSNESLKWVAYIGGKRESRRLLGDYVLTENDLVNQNLLPDGTAPTSWTIDLHYPDPENEDLFEGEAFKSIAKHIPIYPYPIPFRCLYSRNTDNLMMAGRCISVTHVALGTTRLMRTGGMMGEVLGMAASVCKEKNASPREVYKHHFPLLENLMRKGAGDASIPPAQNYNLGRTLLRNDL